MGKGKIEGPKALGLIGPKA